VQLVAPVDPARDHIRGADDAAVTVVEYGEYECPYCAEATVAMRRLEKYFGDDLRLVFRHFPLREVHPNAFNAALAAEAAGRQGKFWELNDLLGPSRRELDPETIYKLAARPGCDVDQFKRDAKDPALRARIEEDIESGLASGVNGTPTFFLNNVRYDGDFEPRSSCRPSRPRATSRARAPPPPAEPARGRRAAPRPRAPPRSGTAATPRARGRRGSRRRRAGRRARRPAA
jgi:protein-disulfide isomerase